MTLWALLLINFLRIDAKAFPFELVSGEKGKINIYIAVNNPNVTLQTLPPFKIYVKDPDSLVFTKNFYTAFDLKALKEGEVRRSEPIRSLPVLSIPFTVNENASPGKHRIKFEIEYLVCSKSGKWCLKTRQRFSSEIWIKSYVRPRGGGK